MEFTKHHVSPMPGEPVLLREIAVFARDTCNRCYGKGVQVFVQTSRSLIDGKKKRYVDSRRELACTCALKQFYDKFSNDVEVVQPAGLKWKETTNNGNEQAQV